MNTKPIANSGTNYDLNKLESRRFEELLHHIFTCRIDDDLKGIFDDAQLMAGVAEEGRDVILQFKGQKKGIIQCKRYQKNIDKPTVAKEIIKFVLYFYKNNSLIDDLSDFTYYFVCSNKFTNTSIDLLTNFKKNILNEKDLKKWTEAVISSKDNKSLNDLKYSEIEKEYKEILANLDVKAKSYSDINLWLGKYQNIVENFFEIKKVIDNSTVEKIVEILNPDLDKKAKKLKADYYKVAKKHLDSVKFIGHDTSFSRPRNITTTKLYVEPFITIQKKKENKKSPKKTIFKETKPLKIHDVFKRSKHYVILGDPGAGKSLMVKHLILRFMKNNAKTGGLKNYQLHTPFRIELRKYNKEKLKNSSNIIVYLASVLEKEYQINNVDLDTLKYIIENQSTLFFFDGLDEVFDTAQKNAICEDIINFTSAHKKVKCLVTSRFVGYEEDLFPEEIFETFGIENFNEKQINNFIKKFYTVQISNTYERNNEIESCKKQLRDVDNSLKSNPLILSLMSLLAINKIVIPDSKLDVYRSCTNTLVETRDRNEKELEFNLRVKSPRGCFGKLGYWQYCSMTDKNQVNKKLAEKTITGYLIKNEGIKDTLNAEEIAREFLDYAEKRSIYFDDNFMHKTFLEYYTADYIFTRLHNSFKWDKRDAIITKYISNSQWHIIFELLISMIDEHNVESEPLDILIKNQLKKGKNQVEVNYFFLSILSKIKNISEDVKKKIITNSIYILIEDKNVDNILFHEIQKNSDIQILKPLFQEVLYQVENDIKDEKKLIRFYNLYYEFCFNPIKEDTEISYKIKNLKKLDNLEKININLYFFKRYLKNKKSKSNVDIEVLVKFIKYFGKESIFNDVSFIYSKSTSWIGLFSIYLSELKFDSLENIENELKKLALYGLTNEYFEEHYKGRYISFRENSESIQNMVQLYIKSENKKVNKFIEILFRDIDKRYLKKFDDKFKDNLKYQKLINQNEVSLKDVSISVRATK